MLPADAAAIIQHITLLWPDWEFNPTQEAAWRSELEAMSDAPGFGERFKRAATKAYNDQTGNWKTPRLARIREALASIPGGGESEATDRINALTGVWTVRLDNRDARAIPQGRSEIPLGRAIDIANEWEEDHARTYGGEWVVVPQDGQPRVYTPHRARALAKAVYGDKMARMDAANKATLAAGGKPMLPSMKAIQDRLRNTLADDKRAKQAVRGQAEEMKGGG